MYSSTSLCILANPLLRFLIEPDDLYSQFSLFAESHQLSCNLVKFAYNLPVNVDTSLQLELFEKLWTKVQGLIIISFR